MVNKICIFIIILLLSGGIISSGIYAQVALFTSNVASGPWNNNTSWTQTGSDADGIPDSGDNVTILAGHQINVTSSAACIDLTVASTGTVNINTTLVTIDVGGNLSNSGTITMGGGGFTETINILGDLSFSGSGQVSGNGAAKSINVTGNLSIASGAATSWSNFTLNVTGTSQIDGQLTLVSASGSAKTFTGDVTVSGTGLFVFNAGQTLTLNGNLIMNAGSSANLGTTSGTINVVGSFTAGSGGNVTIGGVTLSVTGISTINGTVVLSNITGSKTLTGNVTMNSGSGIDFTAAETLTMNGNLTMNGGSSVTGSATGIINVTGTFTAVGAIGNITIGGITLTVTSTSTINDTLILSSVTGIKTLTGNVTMNTGSALSFTANETFAISGSLTSNGTNSILGTTGTVTTGTTFTVSPGAVMSVEGSAFTVLSTSAINGSLTFATSTVGIKTFTGDVTVGATGVIAFTIAETLVMNGNLTTTPGSSVGGGTTGIITLSGNLTILTGGTSSFSGVTITLPGNINIQGTGVLNASSGTNSFTLTAGNWNVTSTAADPFVEGTSSVTFNATSGTQTIGTALAAGETFYNLTVNNTSVTNPGISATDHINVSNNITFTAGNMDMAGNDLIVTGSAASTTAAFTAGTVFSSLAGTDITISDPSTNKTVTFTATNFGDATVGLTTNVTAADILFNGSDFYGTENFTKTGTAFNNCNGGCVFNGTCSFTVNAGAGTWRMGNVSADIFNTATIVHNGANNFIVGFGTTANTFNGTTNITSNTSGGVFFTRNTATAIGGVIFNGPVVINVTAAGNVTFSDGGGAFSNSVAFNSTIQCNSAAASAGDIIFGSAAGATVAINTGSGFVATGTVAGATRIILRNVTQSGSTAQNITTTGTGSLIDCGTAALPCTFAGPVTFIAPGLFSTSAVYNNNATFTSTDNMQLQNNNFNGAINSISFSGATASTQNGGNTYISSSDNTITNSGPATLRFGSFAGETVNGDITFSQTGAGALQPAQVNVCTYAKNITTTGAALTFANAKLNGSANQIITCSAAPIFTALEIANTASGTGVTLNNNLNVNSAYTMTSGIVNINTYTLTLGTGPGAPGTLNYSSGWLYGGNFTRFFNTTAITIPAVEGLFPTGNSTIEYCPFWVGYTGPLTSGGSIAMNFLYTAGTTTASHADGAFGTVVAVSNSTWTPSASGFNLGGNTFSIRYGGGTTSFGSTNAISDINSSLISSVVGTNSGSTNATVAYEANRISIATQGNLNQAHRLGTRNTSTAPLPVDLLSFNAIANENIVHVSWQTASETNCDFFSVEKSQDGINFSELERVKGAGNSSETLTYSVRDEDPYSGISYYRLMQADFNGNYKYFGPISVDLSGMKNELNVFPNPSNGKFTISFFFPEKTSYALEIQNVLGEIIYSATLSPSPSGEGRGEAQIDLSKYGSGVYFLHLTSDNITATQKLTINK